MIRKKLLGDKMEKNIKKPLYSGYKWSTKSIYNLAKLKSSLMSDSQIAKKMHRSVVAIQKKWRQFVKKENFVSESIVKTKEKVVKIAKAPQPAEKSHRKKLDEAIDKTKAELTIKNDYRIYNEMLRQQATVEIITQKLADAVSSLPPLDLKKNSLSKTQAGSKKTEKNSEEEAILLIGDIHCGNFVSKEETSGIGEYNLDMFKTRMDVLTDSVCEITNLHRKLYSIKKLNIFCLGDLVQGMNAVGAWSPAYINQDILTQVFLCIDKMTEMLVDYSQHFEEVNFCGVYGNHGRLGHKGVEKEFVNWDYIMYVFLKMRLQNYPNIKFIFDKSWMQIVNVQNKKFMLVHGDDITFYNSIPFYGIQRMEGSYRSLLEHFKSPQEAYQICKPHLEKLIKNPNDMGSAIELIQSVMLYTNSFQYLVLGHIHQASNFPTNAGGNIIINGAFFGGDVYSIKHIRSATVPVQKFFGVNKKGITWQYDLELSRG